MTKIKEGRYTYYIIPEQRLVKCVSTYAKKPVTGWAKCADTDEFDENTGKEIARELSSSSFRYQKHQHVSRFVLRHAWSLRDG